MKTSDSEVMELQRQADATNGRADSARPARLILLLSHGHTRGVLTVPDWKRKLMRYIRQYNKQTKA